MKGCPRVAFFVCLSRNYSLFLPPQTIPIGKMKKILFTLTFLIAVFLTAQAQLWLGGSVSVHLDKETKTFGIAPDMGYCFADTPFSVGCAVAYEGTFTSEDGHFHSLTLTPYFRYDLCTLEERFSFFIDLAADIEALSFSFFDIGFSPGVSFNISDHWSAEFSYGFLGYQWERGDDNAALHSLELDFKTAAAEFGIYYSF